MVLLLFTFTRIFLHINDSKNTFFFNPLALILQPIYVSLFLALYVILFK